MQWQTIGSHHTADRDAHRPRRVTARAETTTPDGATITAEIAEIPSGYHLLVSEWAHPNEDSASRPKAPVATWSLAAGYEDEAREHAEAYVAELLAKRAAEQAGRETR